MGIPIIRFDEENASQAWDLYSALLRCLAADPKLADDELFRVFKAEAFERFERAFQVMQ